MSNKATAEGEFQAPKLNEKSTHFQEFKTGKMSVPALFFMSRDLLPQDDTFDKLEDVSSNRILFFAA